VIALDATVLIAHLDSEDAHHSRATELLLEFAGEPLAASPLTLAEVFVGPAGAGRLDAARSALDELGVAEIPLGSDAPARLALLRARTSLKLPDCCVLLAAEDASAEAVLSFDRRLLAAAASSGFATPRVA
jgi:predicted nucleic acid-binding protein